MKLGIAPTAFEWALLAALVVVSALSLLVPLILTERARRKHRDGNGN